MDKQWFDLVERSAGAEARFQSQPLKSQTKRANRRRRFLLGGFAVALVLALVAVYAPGIWRSDTVTAMPIESTLAQAPQTLQDSSLVGDSEALADLYASVAPAIVNIRVTSRINSSLFPGFNSGGEDSPLIESQGSGFIYDDLGHIVTNNHVIEDAESVLVNFNNGMWADAEIVAVDPQADLAVIKVTPPAGLDWRILPIDDTDNLRVGHTVVAIGNPFGLAGTMTTGIVSALGRGIPIGDGTVTRYTLPDVIQTDAAINPGNSGGPLIDLNGSVVGVNFAIRSEERWNSGVGFAIPAAVIRRVVPALIEDGEYEYAYLGLSGSSISSDLSAALDLPKGVLGVYVAEVIPGGPSSDAGLQGGRDVVDSADGNSYRRGGDIITAIDEMAVQRFEDLVSYLVTKAAPGQVVNLSVLRDGEPMNVDVTLGQRPQFTAELTAPVEPDEVTARDAIAIATKAVSESGLLGGVIEERVATPDERDGQSVWVVELTAGDEIATVVVDAQSGEVLELTVE